MLGLGWNLSRGFAWQMTMCFPFGNFSSPRAPPQCWLSLPGFIIHVSKAWTAPLPSGKPDHQDARSQASTENKFQIIHAGHLGIPLGRRGT